MNCELRLTPNQEMLKLSSGGSVWHVQGKGSLTNTCIAGQNTQTDSLAYEPTTVGLCVQGIFGYD
jgi:hypothetical protein